MKIMELRFTSQNAVLLYLCAKTKLLRELILLNTRFSSLNMKTAPLRTAYSPPYHYQI